MHLDEQNLDALSVFHDGINNYPAVERIKIEGLGLENEAPQKYLGLKMGSFLELSCELACVTYVRGSFLERTHVP